jgi:hypothetical protein
MGPRQSRLVKIAEDRTIKPICRDLSLPEGHRLQEQPYQIGRGRESEHRQGEWNVAYA